MKKLKIMKKIILLLVTSLFLFAGCEIYEPMPDCEKYDYGTVIVKNQTGYTIWVDVTWGSIVTNNERRISNGNSTKYNEVPSGTIEIWGAFDTGDWTYETKYLSACEELTFKWTYNKSATINKSASVIPDYSDITLEILRNGEVVERITDFKRKNKE